MPPSTLAPSSKPLSGRYLSLAEREEIALWRVQGHGVREIARRLSPSYPTVRAEVRVRQGTGVGLRRRAESVTPIEDRPGWDALVVAGPVHELSDEVLTYGADVVVDLTGDLAVGSLVSQTDAVPRLTERGEDLYLFTAAPPAD